MWTLYSSLGLCSLDSTLADHCCLWSHKHCIDRPRSQHDHGSWLHPDRLSSNTDATNQRHPTGHHDLRHVCLLVGLQIPGRNHRQNICLIRFMKIIVRIRFNQHGGVREVWNGFVHVSVCAGQLTHPVRRSLLHPGCGVWRLHSDGQIYEGQQVRGCHSESAFLCDVLQLPSGLLHAHQLRPHHFSNPHDKKRLRRA